MSTRRFNDASVDWSMYASSLRNNELTAGNMSVDLSNALFNVNINNANYFQVGTSFIVPPVGTSAERPPVPANGYMRFNTDLGTIEYYSGGLWQPIQPSPILTSVDPATVPFVAQDVSLVGLYFTPGALVSFFDVCGTEYVSPVVTFVNSTLVKAQTPTGGLPANLEPYDVTITLPSGLSASLTDAIDAGGVPVFDSPAGSLGLIYDGGRSSSVFSLASAAATDPDGQTLVYSVVSGSVPTGLTLSTSDATWSGTAAAVVGDTTYTFTVRAEVNDKPLEFTERQFSITVKAPITVTFSYTGSTQTWDFSSYALASIDVIAWGGGGGQGSVINKTGGAGGGTEGTVDVTSLTSPLYVVVGKGGTGTTSAQSAGSGGGYAGLFTGASITQGNAILIAGGGGGAGGGTGATSEAGYGGAGGGSSGNDGQDDTRNVTATGGNGGTQVAGGTKGVDAFGAGDQANGSALAGGQGSGCNNSGPGGQTFPTPKIESPQYGGGGVGGAGTAGNWCGAGGGAGYFGGGGGAQGYAGGGGGGSSYLNLTYVSGGSTVTGQDGASTTTKLPGKNADSRRPAGVGEAVYGSTGGNAALVIRF